MSTCIGILHLLGMLLVDSYGILTNPHPYLDTLYMVGVFLLPYSWVMCEDECVLSYVVKKYQDPSYRLGSAPEINDISELFCTQRQYLLFYTASNAVRVMSIFLVNDRTTHIHACILFPTCFFYVFYSEDIACQWNYRKYFFPYFQITLCALIQLSILEILGIPTPADI